MKRFRLQANYKIMAARLHYEIYALTQRLRLTTIRAEHEQAVSEILAKLKQVLAKSNRILAKLKQVLANYNQILAKLKQVLAKLKQVLAKLKQVLANLKQVLAKLKQVLAKSNRILAKLKQDLVTLVSTKILKSTEYNLLFHVGSL